MSYVFGFLGLIFIGVVIGIVLARARRRLEAHEMGSSGEPTWTPKRWTPTPPRWCAKHLRPASGSSWFGTVDQRMQALWACVAACAGAVVLVAVGAPIVGQLVLFVALIMAAQIAVMGAIAHVRARP